MTTDLWQDPATIALWIAIAILFIGLLSVSMVLLVHSGLRKASRAETESAHRQVQFRDDLIRVRIDAGEQEKERIASDLHDHFGVGLSTLKLRLHQLRKASPDLQAEILPAIHDLIDRNIEDMRDLSHGIYPPLLKEYGLIAALTELADNLSVNAGIRIISNDHLLQDEWTSLQLFRICQESLHNAIRHGQADCITIRFRISEKQLILRIGDNGRGFDPLRQRKGMGQIGFDTRCNAIGAKHKLYTIPGKGTVLLIVKPTQ
jgi:signal transduction histidine kinase